MKRHNLDKKYKYTMANNFDIQVERNLQGEKLEKEGRLSEAILLYEANVAENFEGSFP